MAATSFDYFFAEKRAHSKNILCLPVFLTWSSTQFPPPLFFFLSYFNIFFSAGRIPFLLHLLLLKPFGDFISALFQHLPEPEGISCVWRHRARSACWRSQGSEADIWH